jgi:hypothetical protein
MSSPKSPRPATRAALNHRGPWVPGLIHVVGVRTTDGQASSIVPMSRTPPATFSRAIATMILAAIASGILVSAPTASAISSADQYIPSADKGGASGGGNTGVTLGLGNGAPATAGGEPGRGGQNPHPVSSDEGTAGGSNVPGTDFPLTPLAAILIALLAAGLLLRLVVPALDRRA